MEFPILESQRIILRELNECDLLSLFDIYSDQKAMKYWDSTTHNDISETSIMLQNKQKSWHNNIGISWAIELKKTKQLIGQITIHNWQKETHLAKLGYIINPGFWGKG